MTLHKIQRAANGFAAAFFLFLPFLVCFAPAVRGQTLYGSLTGNVTDSTGSAVPNAKVEASNIATGVVKQTQTDDRGIYLMSDLQPGTYRVTILSPAFAKFTQEGVVVESNTVRRLDTAFVHLPGQ